MRIGQARIPAFSSEYVINTVIDRNAANCTVSIYPLIWRKEGNRIGINNSTTFISFGSLSNSTNRNRYGFQSKIYTIVWCSYRKWRYFIQIVVIVSLYDIE